MQFSEFFWSIIGRHQEVYAPYNKYSGDIHFSVKCIILIKKSSHDTSLFITYKIVVH